MSAANFIAFEVTLGTGYVRLSSTRVVCDVNIFNQSASNYCYVSPDAGTNKATVWTRSQITLRGVDLSEIWVASNVAGTIISVTAATPR